MLLLDTMKGTLNCPSVADDLMQQQSLTCDLDAVFRQPDVVGTALSFTDEFFFLFRQPDVSRTP